MTQKGFTLAELIVVIGVMAILGAIITDVFSRSLRGGNKAQIIASIKQNGTLALDLMDKVIKGSDQVVCPVFLPFENSKGSDTLAVIKGGKYTRFRYKIPGGGSNNYIVSDNPVLPTGMDQENFLTSLCTSAWEDGSFQSIITDTNTRSGVSLFVPPDNIVIRERKAGFKDTVTINFKLGPGLAAPASLAGQIDPVAFTTTINLR